MQIATKQPFEFIADLIGYRPSQCRLQLINGRRYDTDSVTVPAVQIATAIAQKVYVEGIVTVPRGCRLQL